MREEWPTPAGYLITYPSGDTAFFEQLPEHLSPGCMIQEFKPSAQDEPRLVSYGLNLETCTLNYQGKEYYFERTSTTAQKVDSNGCVSASVVSQNQEKVDNKT